MQRIRKYIDETYGAGSGLSWISAIVLLIIFLLIGIGTIMLLKFEYGLIFANGLIATPRAIFAYYITLLCFCSGFLFFSLFLYCKQMPENDNFKWFKIILVHLMLLLFSLLMSPLLVANKVLAKAGKKMKISELTKDNGNLLMYMSFVAVIFVVSLMLLYEIGIRTLIHMHESVTVIAVFYYAVFLSMYISNKIAKLMYFKLSRVNDIEKKTKMEQQLNLLWSYATLGVSFIARPIYITNESLDILFSALFYSSAIFTLISTISEKRDKQKDDGKKNCQRKAEDYFKTI